jgi:membrane dipeptidase
MTLTHSNSNHWADSSGDANKPNNGLSPLGKEIVAEMNRLGMIVDIAHVSDKTFWDALDVSKAPIFSSHSSCRAISPAPRNMSDDMIAALGKKRGVVQINFSCDFLNPEVFKADEANREKMTKLRDELIRKYEGDPQGLQKAMQEARRATGGTTQRATLADVVKHINHVVAIAGVEAVGLGSDFDGIGCAPEGLDSVDKWPNLTRALLEEGYTAEEIRKIYGENTLRLMTEVERTAKSLR